MDATATTSRPGPKPIANEIWNRILDLREEGKTAREIISATGLSQTKVYEVLRSGTKKKGPVPTTNPDPTQPEESGTT